MVNQQPLRIRTISEFQQLKQLPGPQHPLISVINFEDIAPVADGEPTNQVLDFYSIALKRNPQGKIRYGQQAYDFDEGILFYIAPGQVYSVATDTTGEPARISGRLLLVHPDFLGSTSMAKTIRHYEYFDYSVHEALFLSDKEEATMVGIIRIIQQEYQIDIDTLSCPIIVAQLEVLLKYAERFYKRQFVTRSIASHHLLDRIETLLTACFAPDSLAQNGLPSVQSVAKQLNVSPNYLSGLLKTLTGQSTQQHIHNRLIERAKEQLSTTNLSINEIAYGLGFEHPQSFSKLFRNKTQYSPIGFRNSFN